MRHVSTNVAHDSTVEVRDFGREPPKVQALVTAVAPVWIVGEHLAHDEAFQRNAKEVALAPDPRACAEEIARRYIRSGAGKHAISRMLVAASECVGQPHEVWLMKTRLKNLSRISAVFENAPLEPGDAKYGGLQRAARMKRYQRGAEVIAHRGAGRCQECGRECGATKVDGYWSVCNGPNRRASWDERLQRKDDAAAAKLTALAIAEQMGFPCDGPNTVRLRAQRRAITTR